jgi:GNAT superfamily N-acetyltransferase
LPPRDAMASPGRLRRLAYRLLDVGRTIGFVRLAWTVPRWLVRREFLVTVKDLSGPLPPPARDSDVAWRRLAPAEIPRLLAQSPTLTDTEVWRRLREGQECWVGWAGDIPAHWRWETSTEAYFPYIRRRVRPLDGDRWIVDVYTHPSWRRRGLYAAATVAAMHRAREQGHRRLIGLIAAWNTPARRVAERELQRSVIGTVGHWAIGYWRPPLMSGWVRLDDRGRVFVPLQEDARPPASVV